MSTPTGSAPRRKPSTTRSPEVGSNLTPGRLGAAVNHGPLRLFERFDRVLVDHVTHLVDRGETLRGAVCNTGRPRRVRLRAIPAPSRILAVELPMTKNDGSPIPAMVWNAVLSAITRRYGGWNCEPRFGLWRDEDGTLYLDTSLKIEVWGTNSKALLALVRRQIAAFGQKCIVVRECVPSAFHVVAVPGNGRSR